MPGTQRLTYRSILAAAAVLTACAPAPVTTEPVPAPAFSHDARTQFARSVDSLVLHPKFRNAHWGVLVVDATSGDTLYSRNAGKLFMPASNMKIVTGAVALAQLGPDFRFQTVVGVSRGADGEPAFVVGDSIIRGDLLVVGRGDPSISDQMRGNAMLPLLGMADSLAARGVRRIEGTVVAVGDAFPGSALGYGWAWDGLDAPYSAGVDELLFNEGFSNIIVRGGAQPNDSATSRTSPSLTYPRVALHVNTVAPTDTARLTSDRIVFRQDSATGTVIVSGSVPAADSVSFRVAHRDPGAAYIAAFREALRMRGIVLAPRVAFAPPAPVQSDSIVPDTSVTAASDSSVMDTLFVISSPPLREILPALEKPSQNQIAEVMLRTLGLEKKQSGLPDSGRRVVEQQLRDWGVDTLGFVIRDGSGLSRHNYLSPEAIVRILDAMRLHPDFDVFHDALPIAGVDGTIRTRMRDTPAQGNLRAKTGSVDRSRALSGYVTTADGRLLIFSTLSNNWTVPASQVLEVHDWIGAALAGLRSDAGIVAHE